MAGRRKGVESEGGPKLTWRDRRRIRRMEKRLNTPGRDGWTWVVESNELRRPGLRDGEVPGEPETWEPLT